MHEDSVIAGNSMDGGGQLGGEERTMKSSWLLIFLTIVGAHDSVGFAWIRISNALVIIAGSLEAAYSLNWGAREVWGKGRGETLALL